MRNISRRVKKISAVLISMVMLYLLLPFLPGNALRPQISPQEAVARAATYLKQDISHCVAQVEYETFGDPVLEHWYDRQGNDILRYRIEVTRKLAGIAELSQFTLHINAENGELTYDSLLKPRLKQYIWHLIVSRLA